MQAALLCLMATLGVLRSTGEVYVAAENRTGRFPSAGSSARVNGDFGFVPGIDLELHGGRTDVSIGYNAQLLLRDLEDTTALVFHRGSLELAHRVSSRLRLGFSLSAQIGELDLSRLDALSGGGGSGTTVLPTNVAELSGGVVPLRTFGGRGRFEYTVGRWDHRLRLWAEDTGPQKDRDQLQYRFRKRADLTLQTDYRPRSDRSFGGEAAFSWVSYRGGPTYVAGAPAARMQMRIGRHGELRLSAGAWLGKAIEDPNRTVNFEEGVATLEEKRFLAMAIGGASLNGLLRRRSRMRLSGEITAGVSPFYDPFRAVLEPRASVGVGIEANWRERWIVDLRHQWFVSAFGLSTSFREAGQGPEDMIASLVASVRYAIVPRAVTLEFGSRLNVRLERGADAQTDLQEFTGFVNIAVAYPLWGTG